MERLVSYIAIRRYDYIVKTADVAEKGHIAFGVAGGTVTVTPNTLPLGLFLSSPKVTGDEPNKVKATIQFWDEVFAYWFGNNANSVTAADIFKVAYAVDDVSVATAGAAPLGLILDVDPAQGVLVLTTYPARALVAGP